jgi:hypothetical protein
MSEYILTESKNKSKKWSLSDGNKRINFGAKGYEDYTIHKDPERKQRYIDRHKLKEESLWTHTKDHLMTPSYLSRYILWEKPNL